MGLFRELTQQLRMKQKAISSIAVTRSLNIPMVVVILVVNRAMRRTIGKVLLVVLNIKKLFFLSQLMAFLMVNPLIAMTVTIHSTWILQQLIPATLQL